MALNLEEGFQAVLDFNYTEEPAVCDPGELEQVVRTRRSVRIFDGTPISEEVVNRCLDLALLAPNSSNLQAWEFYWVRSPEKKAQLVKFCMSQPAARTAAELIVCVARTKTWRKHRDNILELMQKSGPVPPKALDYYKVVVPMVYTQGLLGSFAILKHFMFHFMGLFKPVPREPNFESGMQTWAIKSVCLAASILMLAFRAYGFDSCPMEGIDQKRIKKLLGLPRDARIPMVIGAGKRARNGVYGPRIRCDRLWFVKEV